MPALKRLYNKSNLYQSIVYRGTQFKLAPHEEQQFPVEVADQFIENCMGLVVESEDAFGQQYIPDATQKEVWIANMTGNPDAPPTIPTKRYVNKNWVVEHVHNPILDARDLTEKKEGAMKEYVAKDGALEALNLAAEDITVPRYRRIKLDSDTAKWFLNRAALASDRVPGYNLSRVIMSRAPSNFEPDMSWPLDDMRAYLQLIDAGAATGPSEEEVAQSKKSKHNADHLNMEEIKRTCMKRIYFRVVDPRYRLPTRGEFEEFVRGSNEERIERDLSDAQAEVAAILEASNEAVEQAPKRGRGRPRKHPVAE